MIKSILNEKDDIFSFWEAVYLFGSILTSCHPNDIDVLLIYKSTNLQQAKIEKIKLRDILSDSFSNFDFVLLNQEELKQTKFLKKIVNYIQIK